MLIVISPAKTLDFKTPPVTTRFSQPELIRRSERLIDLLSSKSPADIEALMKISPKLAELNVERYHQWETPFSPDNAKQAILAFKGDVYTGLDAETLSQEDLGYAQAHLRILSGLYGVLRPLDLMQAYRLEMGIKLANDLGKDLYAYWGNDITDKINEQLTTLNSDTLLNLASNEYFKSIKITNIKADIVTPIFKDWKNGQYKLISFYAKKARGLMSSWVIKNKVENISALSEFDVDGYQYSTNDSDAFNPVYLRRLED